VHERALRRPSDIAIVKRAPFAWSARHASADKAFDAEDFVTGIQPSTCDRMGRRTPAAGAGRSMNGRPRRAARAEVRVTVATGKPALVTRGRRPSRSVHRGLIWEAGFCRRAGSRVRARPPKPATRGSLTSRFSRGRLLRRCSIQSSLSHLSRFFRRTPGPPPFSSMNFIPADSRAF